MSRFLPYLAKKELPVSGAVTAVQAAALVQETCRAELVHGASCLLGLAFLWLWPGWGGAKRRALIHSLQIAAFPAGPLDIPMHGYAAEKGLIRL